MYDDGNEQYFQFDHEPHGTSQGTKSVTVTIYTHSITIIIKYKAGEKCVQYVPLISFSISKVRTGAYVQTFINEFIDEKQACQHAQNGYEDNREDRI